MRITQSIVERLAGEVERLTGQAPVQTISKPGDGRTHYVMAESMTSTYYGARQATAYLLGILAGFDPAGSVHHVDSRPQWIADIDNEYQFGSIPANELAAHTAGKQHGETLRKRQVSRPVSAGTTETPGILLTGDQLREWAGLGRDLTGDELDSLEDCIPNSSIPDAISTIVTEALHLTGPDYDPDL